MNYFLLFEFVLYIIFVVSIIYDNHYKYEDKFTIFGALFVTIFGIYIFIPFLFNLLNSIFH